MPRSTSVGSFSSLLYGPRSASPSALVSMWYVLMHTRYCVSCDGAHLVVWYNYYKLDEIKMCMDGTQLHAILVGMANTHRKTRFDTSHLPHTTSKSVIGFLRYHLILQRFLTCFVRSTKNRIIHLSYSFSAIALTLYNYCAVSFWTCTICPYCTVSTWNCTIIV